MAYLTGPTVAFGGGYTSQAFSQTSPQPGAAPALGALGRDTSGNVYVMCDAVGTVHAGCAVQINDDYTCQALATSGRGRVGIAQTTCTSDYYLWVQIYGRAIVQLGMSGVSPSDAANGPTTLSTSAITRFMLGTSLSTPNSVGWTSETSTSGYFIEGMNVASDVSLGDVSAVTSGNGAGGPTGLTSTHTGNQCAVFLNYPYIKYSEGTSV